MYLHQPESAMAHHVPSLDTFFPNPARPRLPQSSIQYSNTSPFTAVPGQSMFTPPTSMPQQQVYDQSSLLLTHSSTGYLPQQDILPSMQGSCPSPADHEFVQILSSLPGNTFGHGSSFVPTLSNIGASHSHLGAQQDVQYSSHPTSGRHSMVSRSQALPWTGDGLTTGSGVLSGKDIIYLQAQMSPMSDVHLDLQNWSDVNELLAPIDNPPPYLESPYIPLQSYFDVSPESSPSPSSSPRSEQMGNLSPSTPCTPSISPRMSPNCNVNGSGAPAQPPTKQCSHCRATSTPLWRREPTTLKPLCNACGLYLQQRNKLRPQELIDADLDDESPADSKDATGPECSHCHTRQTSVWRRSKSGAQLCNACGVYSRLRGKDRPLSLKRNKIKPRSKHVAKQ